jgi:uncharacterized protein
MNALLDTSFMLALTNPHDQHHQAVLAVANSLDMSLVLPQSVLPELCYLLASRAGHHAMRRFLTNLVASPTELEMVTPDDLRRVTEILTTYADSRLDFVDATLVAIAERRRIRHILTLDRRDFTLIRPRHTSHFEILP